MLMPEVMERHGLARDWRAAGFYETEAHRQIARPIRGGLGNRSADRRHRPASVGKTMFLHRLQDEIRQERQVGVAQTSRWTRQLDQAA